MINKTSRGQKYNTTSVRVETSSKSKGKLGKLLSAKKKEILVDDNAQYNAKLTTNNNDDKFVVDLTEQEKQNRAQIIQSQIDNDRKNKIQQNDNTIDNTVNPNDDEIKYNLNQKLKSDRLNNDNLNQNDYSTLDEKNRQSIKEKNYNQQQNITQQNDEQIQSLNSNLDNKTKENGTQNNITRKNNDTQLIKQNDENNQNTKLENQQHKNSTDEQIKKQQQEHNETVVHGLDLKYTQDVQKKHEGKKYKKENKDVEEKKVPKRKNLHENKWHQKTTLNVNTIKRFDNGDDEVTFIRRKYKVKKDKNENTQYKKIKHKVIVFDGITPNELALKMSEKISLVMEKIKELNLDAQPTQPLDKDSAELVVLECKHEPVSQGSNIEKKILDECYQQNKSNIVDRIPIVSVMGHVDHGKTTLLDALRSSNVVDSEVGGITQHIGSSIITTQKGNKITMLDTPGHELFHTIRARGANITDIVILVVAADDGIKEQTIESIKHIQQAKVSVIVAINKIDKTDTNIPKLKAELASHNILTEDMGGDILSVEISALKKINLEQLEEAIILQAELMGLKGNKNGNAKGIVIEANVDSKKGVVNSLLITQGTLKKNDILVADTQYGKIRQILNHNDKEVKKASLSEVVKIYGVDKVINAGKEFVIVNNEKQAKDIIKFRQIQKDLHKNLDDDSSIEQQNTDDIAFNLKQYNKNTVAFIIKADVKGSCETIKESILKFHHDNLNIKIVDATVGNISDSDVELAQACKAYIVAFNVDENINIVQHKADIRHYNIIYELIDDVKNILSEKLGTKQETKWKGSVVVKKVFSSKNLGKIAGSLVKKGEVKTGNLAKIFRNGQEVGNSLIETLQYLQDKVGVIKEGSECGISLGKNSPFQEGDNLEIFEVKEVKQIIVQQQ